MFDGQCSGWKARAAVVVFSRSDEVEVVSAEPVQRQTEESSAGMTVQETLRVDIGRLDQLL
ncbi:MAG: hypothetical protein ACKPHU_20670, partial [Planctomycetaceae bacterium]